LALRTSGGGFGLPLFVWGGEAISRWRTLQRFFATRKNRIQPCNFALMRLRQNAICREDAARRGQVDQAPYSRRTARLRLQQQRWGLRTCDDDHFSHSFKHLRARAADTTAKTWELNPDIQEGRSKFNVRKREALSLSLRMMQILQQGQFDEHTAKSTRDTLRSAPSHFSGFSQKI
jgi:hypothetical protein